MVNKEKIHKPIVLTIAAHDPTGGAGIQADIESISANGCHALSVITALTDQTLTQGVTGIYPQNINTFNSQLESVLEEHPIDAIKIGVIANFEQLTSIVKALKNQKIPIVLDPVIESTSGFLFYDKNFIKCLSQELIPLCSLITPNKNESIYFNDMEHKPILITSSKTNVSHLSHKLITKTGDIYFDYEKLPGEYHGSGCTLSSAIAAQLAHQQPLKKAVENALDYTWQALNTASININNIYIPNRFF